jgi:geranylgeranyl transferase type-2 subunit alpha
MELQAQHPLERIIPDIVRSSLNCITYGIDNIREPEEVVGLLKNEFKLTMAYLQIHPKVYWIWNHRKWCLEHVPLGPAASQDSAEEGNDEGDAERSEEEITEGWRIGFWNGELAVIEALLDADPRNCMSPSPPSTKHLHHTPPVEIRITLTLQSTHGIIVDTSSHHSPHHSHHPGPQHRN